MRKHPLHLNGSAWQARKLLLATVAGLSVTLGMASFSTARAQAVDVSSDDDSGEPFPTPGSVTVRLNGRLRFYADYMPQTHEANSAPLAASTTASAANGNTSNGAGVNKVVGYGFQTYARLYPGFDGVAANGLKYGAAFEVRTGSANTTNASSGQSIGAAGGGTSGTISSDVASRAELFLRRAYGYFGTDKLGIIRVGETDGPTSLYETGTFENYADGNFNGDMYLEMPVFEQLTWPFSVIGNEYSTLKAMYLSPQFYGFDGAVSFEPNTGSASPGIGQGNTGCATTGGATIGCDQLSSSPTYETQRRRNTIEALLRYRGTFGPVGVAATVATIQSGHVSDDGTPRRPVQFQGLSDFDSGIAITYAGLTVGGHILTGTSNAQFALQKANAKDQLSWLAGASYTIGPVILGASYIDSTTEGSNGNLTTGVDTSGQRREQGVAVGTTYSVAPGFAVFAEAMWDQRKEGNYDFLTGANDAAHNKVTGQLLGIGTSFAW